MAGRYLALSFMAWVGRQPFIRIHDLAWETDIGYVCRALDATSREASTHTVK